MEFRNANCPHCKGELQIPVDKEQVKCMYCGGDIKVQEVISSTSKNKDVTNLLQLANIAIQGDNLAEALNYINKALEMDAHIQPASATAVS